MFTHKVRTTNEERSFTTLYFKGDDASNEANTVAEKIGEWGPVESPKRTVDFARSHSLSAPGHYTAYVVVLYGRTDSAGRRAVTVDTNAPDELLAMILLNNGETWAGHAERAGIRSASPAPAPVGINHDDTTGDTR